MNSCKKCSTCCGIKRYAELECIYLKQCKRTNCNRQMENEGGHVPKVENVSKVFATPERITHQRRTTHRTVSQSNNSEAAGNRALKDIVSQFKKTKFRREVDVNRTIQSADTDKYAPKEVEEITTPKDDISSPPTSATVNGDSTATLITTQSKSQGGLDTVPDYSVLQPTLPLTSSYFSSFQSILIALLSIAVVMLILIAVLIAWKRQSGQHPGSCCTVTCCVRVYLEDGEEKVPFKTGKTA